MWRPNRAELAAARDRQIADVLAPGLRVVFCGINPGLYSGAVGHHFARPGNRFWPTLHLSGFTDGQLSPFEDRDLLGFGLGCTNLISRTTARADELAPQEFSEGAERLREKLERFRPVWLALLGIGAYRLGFGRPRAAIGEQPDRIGPTRVWLLPNPSGLNAHYQRDALADAFRELRASC
ncbi:G/U mismatch-specific DNA glycosylase [Candidatus Dormiibacter inghamiae]|uniref:G/U mismatch-specific DNA glycosylase n=1 Tax=Candidatus Dormiibacter inghamiae TaxID=3127013 RepID=UPI0030C6B01D